MDGGRDKAAGAFAGRGFVYHGGMVRRSARLKNFADWRGSLCVRRPLFKCASQRRRNRRRSSWCSPSTCRSRCRRTSWKSSAGAIPPRSPTERVSGDRRRAREDRRNIFRMGRWTSQRIVVPWMVISSRVEAKDSFRGSPPVPPRSARRTSISGALAFGADLLAESGFRGMKRVIDVSGDGPNNQGRRSTGRATWSSPKGSLSTGCR